jgi:hypothetical protein
MLKKIALWSLYAALVALLLAGAIYRTSVKLGDGEQEQNQGSGSQGNANGQTNLDPSVDVPGETIEEHASENVQERSVADGQVVEISNRGISIQLSNGELFEISGRAWRYAQGLGFSIQVGDAIWLEGYAGDGGFEAALITNLDTGQSVVLRDENGYPLWNGK